MRWSLIFETIEHMPIRTGILKKKFNNLELGILFSIYNETKEIIYDKNDILDLISNNFDPLHLPMLESYPETVAILNIPFLYWIPSCPIEEAQREVSVKNVNYKEVLKEKENELKNAEKIIQLELSEMSSLLANWIHDQKYMKLSFKELVKKDSFQILYLKYINKEGIEMPYVRLTRSGLRFEGGGHRLMFFFKLNQSISVKIIDQR